MKPMSLRGAEMDGSKDKGFESGGFVSVSEEEMELRRGPWTVEEDITLMNYIANHGDGRWNSLARAAGLKRTGKSCRLRWLNYLRPDVRRGNITLEEQLLILELHSQWGNRWSKIAQHLPGRTDNEIKNYWRTRVQKHAKQLKCDVNSKQFKDTMRYLWMPRLVERIHAAAAAASTSASSSAAAPTVAAPAIINGNDFGSYMSENSSYVSSDSFGAQVSPASELTECYNIGGDNHRNPMGYSEPFPNPTAFFNQELDLEQGYQWSLDGADMSENFWNVDDDVWFLKQ